MPEPRPSIDLLALLDAHDTDLECRTYLEELRWPHGLICPRCSGTTISRITRRKQFDCDKCRYQFSVTAGTVFHDSHLGLPKWFVAVYLLCESQKGMSANHLKRILKVNYKTAWYLCHRIRAAMTDANPSALTGTVERDETYAGRGRGRGRGNRDRRTMALAAVRRGETIRMTKGQQKHRTREERHGPVNHSLKEYGRGDVHTSTVESAFSVFKRSLVGSFHQVSAKHVDRYLDECEWRFNNRTNAYVFRDTVLKLIEAEKLEYKKLTA